MTLSAVNKFACARSWAKPAPGSPWTFCTRPKGHEGECTDWKGDPKPADALYFDQMPDAAAQILKQIEDERKAIAKKQISP